FFQAEDGIRDGHVTGVQTCALPICLPREDRERVRALETVWSTSSTNTVLLARANPPVGTSEVLLAEHQSAGRGRRGRAWLAPPRSEERRVGEGGRGRGGAGG